LPTSRKICHRHSEKGILPESIADILITHIHGDHIGGLADFPNAKIHIAREEYGWAAATSFAEKEQLA